MTQPQYAPAFLEGFWSKVDRNGPIPDYAPHLGPCWIWTAALSKGYGDFAIAVDRGKWKNKKAHRVAYELLIGPIPDGLQLDHLCRVRECVNPAHVEPVDSRTNTFRGEGPAVLNAQKTHCHRGHANWIADYDYPNRRRCKTCKSIDGAVYRRKRRQREQEAP